MSEELKQPRINQFNIDGVHYFSVISLNNLICYLLKVKKASRESSFNYLQAMFEDASRASGGIPATDEIFKEKGENNE